MQFGAGSTFQRDFAQAILRSSATLPAHIAAPVQDGVESRFGVYRNNVIASLIRSLATRYPVVRRLLWEESFDSVARLYVAAHPPRSPVMLEYGDGFPAFIRSFGQDASLHYVADIAALESARRQAYHAGDAVPAGRGVFDGLTPEDAANLRLALHPSTILLTSRFPVVSIWEANQPDGDNEIAVWRSEAVLVARPELTVEVRRLTAGTYCFLTAIAQGRTVATAVQHAIDNAADLDLTECLTTLMAANIVVAAVGPRESA